jgi:LPXTG-motif cell wall-anchored protein
MRRFIWLLGLTALTVLLAAPAHGAGSFVMSCPVCDHVDVEAKGLKPNTTLTLDIRDVRTGQQVIPNLTTVTTDQSGSFSREFPMDLAKHPLLVGSLYNRNGTDLVLAAHTTAQAPAHCKRATTLPYTGASSRLPAALAGALLGMGGLLVLATRRRSRRASP